MIRLSSINLQTRGLIPMSFALTALLVVGCGKKTEETENPDGAGEGGEDVADGGGEEGETPSRGRGSSSTRDGGGTTKARAKPMKAARPPRAKKPEETSINGVASEGWAISGATALPDFSTLSTAEKKGTLDMVNVADQESSAGFPGLGLSSNFAVRLSGSLNITTEAEYELCLNSDDGSQLLLEGTVVVDNDGVKDGAGETCGLVYLAAGEYMLAIHYFQADGERMALQFAWAQDGGEKSLVPTEVLFKPAR